MTATCSEDPRQEQSRAKVTQAEQATQEAGDAKMPPAVPASALSSADAHEGRADPPPPQGLQLESRSRDALKRWAGGAGGPG